MAEHKYVKAEIRRASDRARAEAPTSGPCEVCGSEDSALYAFAYARATGETSEPGPSGMTTTTYYDSVGSRAVRLCERCILPTQKRLAARPMKFAAGIAAVLLVAGIFAVRARGWDISIVFIFSALLLALPLYMQRRRILSDIRIAGQKKAQELYEPQLRSAGLDTFWNDPDEV